MAEAAAQQLPGDDWKDIHPAEVQASPYSHGDDWYDIAPPVSLNEFAGPKITETPLYKAGESIQKLGRETFPVSEEERAAHPYASAIGRTAGAVLPAAAATLGLGPAGVFAGAAQMGTSTEADTFDDALAHGADERTASKAAGISGALGMALGAVDLGVVLAPLRRSLPGMTGWAAQKLAQAGQSGVTFAAVGQAQQYLNTEIEKEIYNPDATYSPQFKDMLAAFVVGGGLGAAHPLRPTDVSVVPPEGAPRSAEGRPEAAPEPAVAPPPPAEPAPAATLAPSSPFLKPEDVASIVPSDEVKAQREETPPSSQEQLLRNLTVNDILHPDTPAEKPRSKNNVEIARYLEQRGRDAMAALGIDSPRIDEPGTPADEFISRAISSEVKETLNRDTNHAADWYTGKVKETMQVASLLHPELADDPNARMLYTLALAVTSQGETVPSNIRLAEKAYDHYQKTGSFPTDLDVKKPSINANLKKANEYIEAWGLADFRNFLHSDFTAGELNKHFKDYTNKAIAGENVDTPVKGSAIFGPKIGGGFFQNLNGNYDPVTMDLWFMRSWGRLTGTLVGATEDVQANQRTRLVNALRAEGKAVPRTNEQLRDSADQIIAVHEKDFVANRGLYDSGERKKSELVKATERYVFGQDGINEAPTSGSHRQWMRARVNRARELLAADGVKVTNADLQAILWYPEKDLYAKLGGRDAAASGIRTDYSQALQNYVKAKGITDEQIANAIRSVDRGPGQAGGAAALADERRAADATEGRPSAGAATGELPGRGELPGGAVGLAPPGAASSALGPKEPLRGLPTKVTVPGMGQIDVGPNPKIRRLAADYMQKAGLPYDPPTTYAKVDEGRAKRIADAFDAMPHAPNDPDVKAAYKAMAKETMAQWRAIQKTGLKVEFIRGADPYAASPRLAVKDINENNHMWVFPTSAGFGSGHAFTAKDIADNPLLAPAGVKISGQPATLNDIFRIVHDYFGHAKEGVGFRADGEENAWRSHSAMYSPLARKAMTTETRGQNSWLNFGPHGEANRTAKTENTVFADQKVGVLPDWVVTEGARDFADVKSQRPEEPPTATVGGHQLETIVGAAYKINGKVYSATNHILAMDAAVKDLGVGSYADLVDIQGGLEQHREGDGFVTSTGRFVGRDEAKQIAESAGQGKATANRGIKAEDLDMAKRGQGVATQKGLPPFRTSRGWESAEGYGEPQGQKIRIGRDTYAYISSRYTAAEQEIANAVMEIGAKMAPKAQVRGVAALRQNGATIWGGFVNNEAFPQLIAWSLEKGDAGNIGQTVRHEIIHHLRNAGLFQPNEWKALRDAAVHNGWLQEHRIYDRYPDLSSDHKIEESVAEEFAKWRAERSLVKPGLIRDAFMRLDLFLRRVAAAVRKTMGFNATPSDIFTRIETGEVGRREPIKRASGGRILLHGQKNATSFESKHSEAKFGKAKLSRTEQSNRAAPYKGAAFTRKASRYSASRGTNAKYCANCSMFRKPHACTAVGGFIAKRGLCDWWESGTEKVTEHASGGRVITDTSKDVRWMSEMSKEGDVFYRDRSLPDRIINNKKWLVVNEPLKRHEVEEYAAIKKATEEFVEKHGRKPNDAEREAIYLKAHSEHGEVAENHWLRSNGYSVKEWDAWCRGKLAHLEHKRISNPPPDPHVRPSPHDRRKLESTL